MIRIKCKCRVAQLALTNVLNLVIFIFCELQPLNNVICTIMYSSYSISSVILELCLTVIYVKMKLTVWINSLKVLKVNLLSYQQGVYLWTMSSEQSWLCLADMASLEYLRTKHKTTVIMTTECLTQLNYLWINIEVNLK